MNIDMHCHMIPENCMELHAQRGGRIFGLKWDADGVVMDGVPIGRVCDPEQLYDPARRYADMERMGIDAQIVSVPPFMFFYGLDAATGLEFARRLNDGLAEAAAGSGGRLYAMCTVPLQDVPAATAELERCVKELGMVGVEINSNVNGRNLDAKEYYPFFAKAAELDVPVFIHPHYVAAAERLGSYYLVNLIGNPLDTSIAAASLVFSGLLEALPNLKVVLAHGGGSLPGVLGRWDHGHRVRPECMHLPRRPSEYVRRMYADTVVHSAPIFRLLVETFTAEHIVLGTDYPFDMGDLDPIRTLESFALPGDMWRGALESNVRQLFRLAS